MYPTAFVITGPSGVGKSTLLEQAMYPVSEDLVFSVSSTTREPRPGEEDGVDYHFVTPEDFKAALAENRFIEHAQVFGNWYGTSWSAVQEPMEEGKSVVLDLDLQGHRTLRAADFDAVHIFIAPPSLGTLKHRLEKRGEKTQNIIRRMAEAETILEAQHEYDHVVVNDDLQTAVFALLGIFMAHMEGKL